MFKRESSGVYRFGSKRVGVKVERDTIQIRVGGGYLAIDQFLEQYTPMEIEKLERNNPVTLKTFSEMNCAQKTIVNKSVKALTPMKSLSKRSSSIERSPLINVNKN